MIFKSRRKRTHPFSGWVRLSLVTCFLLFLPAFLTCFQRLFGDRFQHVFLCLSNTLTRARYIFSFFRQSVETGI